MQLNNNSIIGGQNDLQAEQLPVPAGIVSQPGTGYNGGQAIPIQKQQGQSNQEYFYNQHQPRQPQQQVFHMNPQAPQVVVIYATPILTLEYQFRNQNRWFYSCSCIQSFLMIIILSFRSIWLLSPIQDFVDSDKSAKAACVFYIIVNIFWFGCLPIGFIAISGFKIQFMKLTQIGLNLSLLFEIVADFVLFASKIIIQNSVIIISFHHKSKEFKGCHGRTIKLERKATTAIISKLTLFLILFFLIINIKISKIIYFYSYVR